MWQNSVIKWTLKKKKELGTSLVLQWLRLSTPNAGGQGLIPGQEDTPEEEMATQSSTVA